jgi:ATP-dependent DNA helicase RecG
MLDGTILYTTLEPCAPGSRNNGKISCAERIVNARIKEVCIGIQDPDPTVQGKGQEYLELRGIKVRLFEPDLQEQIRRENKEFLNQAIIRAKEAEENKNKIVNKESVFDQITQFSFQDLSIKALRYYRQHAGITEDINSEKFQENLIEQGLIVYAEGKMQVTGLGYFLFGENPRVVFPQAGLSVTLRINNQVETIQNFYNSSILVPHLLELWLREKFPTKLNRNQMIHQEESVLPMEIIRESVINAIIHRDYGIEGAKCQLEITDNMIVVKSPGRPMHPITLDQLNSFKAPASNRNPKLAFIFSLIGLAEERGLGMRSFSSVDRDFSLPKPFYKFEEPYLVFTQYRNRASSINSLPKDILAQLSDSEIKGWEILANESEISREEYQNSMNITARTSQRHFQRFIELGLLTVIGSGPSTKYKVNKP